MPDAPLVLLRHGQSTANADGTFTGSRDVDLSAHGVEQSVASAAALRAAGLVPDVVVTSRMVRARRTAEVVVTALAPRAELVTTWRLNERDYGVLMGMPKVAVRSRFGDARFHRWRRTLYGRPPGMPAEQRAGLGLVPVSDDPDDPQTAAIPGAGESLHDVVVRVRPLWQDVLLPRLRAGSCVLVVGHGNSLRALCALLDRLDDHELQHLNIPTAQPLVYRVGHEGGVTPRGGVYLDPEAAAEEAARIAAEGGL